MIKVLVIQGAGMELRGIENVEIFGPATLDDINAAIQQQAAELDVAVEIIQSNDEQAVAVKLNELPQRAFDAVLINPAGFTASTGPLPQAIANLQIPTYEIHASNPTARGITSTIGPHCQGTIYGFGYAGYRMGLAAIQDSQRA